MEKIQKPYIAMICTDGDAGVCMVLPGHVQAHPCGTHTRLLSRKVLVRPYTPQLSIKRRASFKDH